MQDKAEQARALFLAGANCAQAVFGAFHQECGLDFATAMRLSSSFGGGMGRLREVCGALSGSFMAAGLLRGYADLQDKEAKDAHYALIQRLAGAFRQETGSLLCRDLLGLDPEGQPVSPVSEARTPAYYQQRPCADLVALAAAQLAQELASAPSVATE